MTSSAINRIEAAANRLVRLGDELAGIGADDLSLAGRRRSRATGGADEFKQERYSSH